MAEEINKIISDNSIVVFSGDYCPYCVEAIKSLKEAGVEPTVIKATHDQREALFDMTNVGSIPNIWIKGKFVGGCNDGPGSFSSPLPPTHLK